MKKVFAFDAEANGLWGQPFAIAALVLDEDGREIARFVDRCPIEGPVDEFVREKVLPNIRNIPEWCRDYPALLTEFAKFYLANRDGADCVVHMGYIVEARVLRDLHDLGLLGDFEAPYPLYDVSGNLQAAGKEPTSVDSYLKKEGLVGIIPPFGETHHPLYDAAATAVAYRHLLGWRTPAYFGRCSEGCGGLGPRWNNPSVGYSKIPCPQCGKGGGGG